MLSEKEKKYQKEYYLKNKKRLLEQQKGYSQINKEKIKSRTKEYLKRPEIKIKLKEYHKNYHGPYYQKNKDKINEYKRKYRQRPEVNEKIKEYGQRLEVKRRQEDLRNEWRKNGKIIDFKEEDKREYNHEVKQILLGSLLGDGCISLSGKRSIVFVEGHSIKQKEYLLWKKEIFEKEFNVGYREYTHSNTWGGEKCSIRFSDISLGFYYKNFYPNGKKIISNEMLDMMDEMALAVWYQDDGSLSRGCVCRISTLGFDDESCKNVVEWMSKKYDINFIVDKVKRNFNDVVREYNCLRARKEDSLKFIELIKLHIHPSLVYKMDIKKSIENQHKYFQIPEVKHKKNKWRREQYSSNTKYKEEINELNRQYRLKNREEINRKQNENYQKNKLVSY